MRIVRLILALCLVANGASIAADRVSAPSVSATKFDSMPCESYSDDLTEFETQVPAPAQRVMGFYSSPGFQIGSTYQDIQHNARMARQIVVGGGWVHNIWTHLPGTSTANRKAQFFSWQINGPGAVYNDNIDSSVGAGYCSIDYDLTNGGAAVVGYHRTASGGTRFSREAGVGTGAFSQRFTFPAANCQGIVGGFGPEGIYIWPVIATDIDDGGNSYLHCVSTESPPSSTTDMQSIIYYRSAPGISGAGATCGTWIDSVENIMATVCADPTSNDVAIVYFQPADYAFTAGAQQRNNTVVYRESHDLGDTWGPVVDVTNYTGADKERAYSDVSAMYTSDGCLHITWNAGYFDSGVSVSTAACNLRHWDDCIQCNSMLLDAQQFDADGDRGSWQLNICRMSISECMVDDQKRLYITYTQFLGDADDSIPGPPDHTVAGFSNGELFMQVSSTNGMTWGPPINLTNTFTPNSAAGFGASENWSSSAMYVSDSLRVQYILDLDAGRITGTEGTWTNNPVMNMAAPCVAMADWTKLTALRDSIRFAPHILIGNSRDTVIVLRNEGNQPINYTRSLHYVDSSGSLTVLSQPATGSIPAGCSLLDSATIHVTANSTGPTLALIRYVYDAGSSLDTLDVKLSFNALRPFCCLHGDANNDQIINISDAVYLIAYVFAGGPAPATECLGDTNCDCDVNISDAVFTINFIFTGGNPPPSCCPSCVYDW